MAQVSAIGNYPFGISDTSIIVCEMDTVHSADVEKIVKLTQAQYEALETKDADTMYVITDNV